MNPLKFERNDIVRLKESDSVDKVYFIKNDEAGQ